MSIFASRSLHGALVLSFFAATSAGCASSAGDPTTSEEAAISADAYEASASSAQSSHLDVMLFSAIASGDPATAAANVAAQTAWWPAGCATRERDATNPNVVHVTLHECTGPFGLVHWDGDIDVTFSKNAAGGLHADAVGVGLTVNGRAVEYQRQADIEIAGADRIVTGHASWTRVNDKGETVAHVRDGQATIDTAKGCRTVEGDEVTTVGAREVDSTLKDYEICRTATGAEGCPTGTLTQVHKASGRTITITFDGTNEATVAFPKATIQVPLVCGG